MSDGHRPSADRLRRGGVDPRSLEDDPTRVFALLAERPVPRDVLDRVSADVAAAVEAGVEVSDRFGRVRRGRVAAAWAAAVVLAAALAVLPGGLRRSPSAPGAAAALREASAVSGARVAVLESPGRAQMLELAVGETRLVMIFDEEFDL